MPCPRPFAQFELNVLAVGLPALTEAVTNRPDSIRLSLAEDTAQLITAAALLRVRRLRRDRLLSPRLAA